VARTSELAAIYPILPPDGQFTRIMSLQPGGHEATLSFETRTTSLEEAGEYEALSYTWGSEVPCEDTSCNNSTLTLRPNLASALKRGCAKLLQHEIFGLITYVSIKRILLNVLIR
jgi:Heterokaryon incompatibility protein (HET)